MQAFIFAVAAVAAVSSTARAAWGLRFEVSSDGVNWVSSISANQGDVIKFRMGSYFDVGTKITTPDGTGNALALRRFTGQTCVDGFGANDAIQNLTVSVNNNGAAFRTINGNLIGTTSSASFAQQFSLDPLPAQPVLYLELFKAEIVVGVGVPRLMTVMNNSFGTDLVPGLTFFHDASRANQQYAAPSDPLDRTDINATIQVIPAPATLIPFALLIRSRRRA